MCKGANKLLELRGKKTRKQGRNNERTDKEWRGNSSERKT